MNFEFSHAWETENFSTKNYLIRNCIISLSEIESENLKFNSLWNLHREIWAHKVWTYHLPSLRESWAEKKYLDNISNIIKSLIEFIFQHAWVWVWANSRKFKDSQEWMKYSLKTENNRQREMYLKHFKNI